MTEPTDDRDDRAERAFRAAFEARAAELEPVVLDVRRRGRRVLLLVAAAAAVVLVATAATFAIGGAGGSDDRERIATEPSATPEPGEPRDDALEALPQAAPGFHWVSRQDVAVQVPDSWGLGSEPRSDWCVGYDPRQPGKPPPPYVDLAPDSGAVRDILCTDENSAPAGFEPDPTTLWAPHLTFSRDNKGNQAVVVPFRGWQLDRRVVNGVRIQLQTDEATRPLVSTILDSAQTFSTDQNGCDATSPIQAKEFVRPEPGFDIAAIDAVDSVSLCLYPRFGTQAPGLLGSRRLVGEDATALLGAIQAAPVGGGPEAPQNCVHDYYGDTGTVVRLDSGDDTRDVYTYTDWCFGNGFDDGVNRRTLTKAACSPIFAEPPVQVGSGDGTAFELCAAHSYG